MSKTAYNAVCACAVRHPAKAVLKEMAWFADDEGQNIWPSVQTLAERTGLSRRSVQKLLRNLEEVGAIRGLGSRLGGRRKTTHYRIELGWVDRNSESANRFRPFSRGRNTRKNENSEQVNPKSANNEPQNSARRSPDQKEQENEKNAQPLPLRTDEQRKTFGDREPERTSPYELQRLRQRMRAGARSLSMPSPMTPKELQARRSILKEQAESLIKNTVSVTATHSQVIEPEH